MHAKSSDLRSRRPGARKEAHMKGVGRAVFVAVLFLIIGVLNIIYGIAAIGNAHFFNGTQYVFSSLHT